MDKTKLVKALRSALVPICIALAVFVCSVLLYRNTVMQFIAESYNTAFAEEQPVSSGAPVHMGDILTQRFKSAEAVKGYQFGFEVLQGEVAGAEGAGISAVLYDADTSEVLNAQSIDVSGYSNGIYQIMLPAAASAANGNYLLELAPINMPQNTQLAFFINGAPDANSDETVAPENAQLADDTLAGTALLNVYTGDDSSVKMLYAALTLICAALAVLLYLCRSFKPQNYFLVAALGFGFIISFLISPMSGFDMPYHHDIIYTQSNKWLGHEGFQEFADESAEQGQYGVTARYYIRRACDGVSVYPAMTESTGGGYFTNLAKYITEDVSGAKSEMNTVQTARQPGRYNFLYLPQVIAYTLARLLCLNSFFMMFMARWFNFAVFVFCAYFAIKCVPFGKYAYMTAALFPCALFQAMNITRDAMIMSLCFFVTAKIIELACTDKKITIWQLAQLVIPAVLLAPQKYIYLPFCLLSLLIPLFRYKGKNKKRIIAAVLCGGALIVLALIVIFWRVLAQFIVGSSVESVSIDNVTRSYMLSDIIAHPLGVLGMCLSTLVANFGKLLAYAIGVIDINTTSYYAGFGNSIGVIMGFLVVAVAAALPQKGENGISLAREKACRMRLYTAGAFLAALVILAYASICWTPITSPTIGGMQGRYITPMLPILFAVLLNNKQLTWLKRPVKMIYAAVPSLLFLSVMTYIFNVCHGRY